MAIDVPSPDTVADDAAPRTGARWFVAVSDASRGLPPRWSAYLAHPSLGVLAASPLCASRGEVDALIGRVEQVAHVDDGYQRLDTNPSGLQFLLHDARGRLLLIGLARRSLPDRERALTLVKRVSHSRVSRVVGALSATRGS
jgi:hypothetical protein